VETAVWPEATKRLKSDPAFGALVKRVGPVRLRPSRGNPFESLCSAICYQQLAGKAAQTIHGRFVQCVGGRVTPESVLRTPEATLRGAGLSGNKMAAIRDLAEHASKGLLDAKTLRELDDDGVIERLSVVRGVGKWTAEMFLLFDLQRPDIWPVGDLGVRAGLGRTLGWESPPTPKETELIGVGYRPWRSAVAWYCWRALDAD
jgi:DNA-3-methyladenine glycosylase II